MRPKKQNENLQAKLKMIEEENKRLKAENIRLDQENDKLIEAETNYRNSLQSKNGFNQSSFLTDRPRSRSRNERVLEMKIEQLNVDLRSMKEQIEQRNDLNNDDDNNILGS